MKHKQRARWEKIRAKGKRHCILRFGITWGFVVGVLYYQAEYHGQVFTLSEARAKLINNITELLGEKWTFSERHLILKHRYGTIRKL